MDNSLKKDALRNRTVLLTGAGGGIGFEAAKTFVAMGAKVIIAEINKEKGLIATKTINAQFPEKAIFINIDLTDGKAVKRMCRKIITKYGCPDIIFNNAAIVVTNPIGEIEEEAWDRSYSVNLKAPFLLTTFFIKAMKERNSGCIVFVSSSGAAPYLGGYETFKTAQVEFSNTLSMELEGSKVYTYTIAPGLVKTNTAEKSIENVAKNMGMSTKEFYRENESHILNVGDAGMGFAVSTLKANEYNGQEISSIQALNDFNVSGKKLGTIHKKSIHASINIDLLNKIINSYLEQYNGWQSRNIFEKQWVLRDFKKSMSLSADDVQKEFTKLKNQIALGEELDISKDLFEKLENYWKRQYKLLQGFEKDKDKLASYGQTIKDWILDIETLLTSL